MTPAPAVRLALLLVFAAASAEAEGLLPREGIAGAGCTGTVSAGAGLAGAAAPARVIFHDGSHAPVSVPLSTPGDAPAPALDGAATTTGAVAGSGGGAATSTPGTEPARQRSSPRWQTFLPGSLK